MSQPTILPATATLAPTDPDTLSVLSYNVLLPNSVRGWWLFKYYQPTTDDAHRAWPHRQRLLRDQLLGARPDIVCIQEAIFESFDEDFAFMAEAGYTHALHRKGDQRCATFWRSDKFAPSAAPQHRDKTLITSLRPIDHAHITRSILVINCHLIAGPDLPRRLRQIDEALDQARRELVREGHDLASAAVVVCGDFNSDAEGSAVDALLRAGQIAPDFRDPTQPELQVTSKPRQHPFQPFEDAYKTLGSPTMLFKHLTPLFLTPEGTLSAALTDAIDQIFTKFSALSADKTFDHMDLTAVDAWITTINKTPRRGSEWDKAQAAFVKHGREILTQQDLQNIYTAELFEGKFWAVHHDLNACGVGDAFAFVPGERPFEARYDRIYFTPNALTLEAIREPLTPGQRALVYDRGDVLPNAWHPSDHLPVGVVLRWGA